MTVPGTTDVFLLENARTERYIHYNKEIATGDIDGANTDYEVTNTMGYPIGTVLGGSLPLAHYVDSDGEYLRKDFVVYFELDGVDTVVDTQTWTITATVAGVVTINPAPETTDADKVKISYCHTKEDVSNQITNIALGGGGRPLEYVTVQGGKKIQIKKAQDPKTLSFDLLSVDEGWSYLVNGQLVEETSGSNYIKGDVGAGQTDSYAFFIIMEDKETGNYRVEQFHNAAPSSNEKTLPSDSYMNESAAFESAPQDYAELTLLNNQNESGS